MPPTRILMLMTIFCAADAFGSEPVAELRASDDPTGFNAFGSSPAVDGDTVVVGAPGDDTVGLGFDNGAVYVFRYGGSRWEQEAKLIGSQAGLLDYFGSSVAIQGDLLVAGQPHGDPAGSDFGAAYVFRRTGGTWVEEQILTPSLSALNDGFGSAVAIAGERLVVGATGSGFNSPVVHRAFVFRWDGTHWVEEGILNGSDTVPEDEFGHVLAIDGETVVVGVPADGDLGVYSGSAYVFERRETGWAQTQKLTAGDGSASDFFGRSVALRGDRMMIGASGRGVSGSSFGAVYVFRRTPAGWIEDGLIMPADPEDGAGFGWSVGLNDTVLLVGANRDDRVVSGGFTIGEGSAYVFDFDGLKWVQRAKIARPDPSSEFAHAVALSGAWAAIPSFGSYGSVFVYCVGRQAPCIPTMGTWGMVLLAVLIVLAASRRLRHGSASLACLLAFALPSTVVGQDARLAFPHHPGQLFVQFRSETSEKSRQLVHDRVGGAVLWTDPYVAGLTLVRVSADRLAVALGAYADDPDVLYAEPDYYLQFLGVPNDTHFTKLWTMQNTGDNVPGDPGTPGADIRAVPAWDFWQGDENFRIAVLDTGARLDHEDLTDNIWTNPLECPGGMGTCVDNGIDEDANGYVDDFYGWNFYTLDGTAPNDPRATHVPGDPGQGHGTKVSGILGARGDNAKGVTGVNWRCKIVVLRICVSSNQDIVASRVVAALTYVISNNIKVSNNSYAGGPFCQALYNKIRAAREMIGHIFVAGAGNDGTDNDVHPFYPASFDLSNIIAVTGMDNDDKFPSSDCNYGATSVDLGAPWGGLFTTSWFTPTAYEWFPGGTSLATPHVTGVVALLWSKYPTWKWTVVKNRVLRTVRHPDPNNFTGRCVTGGVVNAFAAMNDCNLNGIPDDQELAAQSVPDCNANGVPDSCDIADGFSEDCQPNGVPDDCESGRACCLPDDSCHVCTQTCCAQAGGTFLPSEYQCHSWTCPALP